MPTDFLLVQPFLPRLPDEVVSAALRDISLRAPVTAATPPSCAFFTFVNAKQTLNCSTFNCDGSKIVGECGCGVGGAGRRPWMTE